MRFIHSFLLLSLVLTVLCSVSHVFASAVQPHPHQDMIDLLPSDMHAHYHELTPAIRNQLYKEMKSMHVQQQIKDGSLQSHSHTMTHQPASPVIQRAQDTLSSQPIKDAVSQIIDYATNPNSPFAGQSWWRLADFTDTIGNRICGSSTLEGAVQYMVSALQADGLENVHAEKVILPAWSRGNEYAKLVAPREQKLNMLGLGGSVGTNGAEITADVLVVQSFAELQTKAAQAQGKIVVFNEQCDWNAQPIRCYGTSVIYRAIGAVKAAQVGAVAALIRTVGAFSINSPHTGIMQYNSSVTEIPTAALTIEDVEMLQRMSDNGVPLQITLYMEAENLPPSYGHNVIAEWVGSEYPNETVIVSGHLDSWDVGQGAMDDGGGASISWSVLTILKNLNIRPKRTIRLVMWSCEEFGGIGGNQYFQAHKDEVPTMSLVMESDLGVFLPQGIQFVGNPAATTIMQNVLQLLAPINASTLVRGGGGEDINPWMVAGVPGASLLNENDRYFWFHHSWGDMMTVLDPHQMDLCAATWAVTAYAVASLDDLLPR